MVALLLAVTLLECNQGGVSFRIEGETKAVDPGRSLFLTVEARAPAAKDVRLPDLRERAVGFSLVEENASEPRTEKDGSRVQSVEWRLVPEPCAKEYRLKPLVVADFYTPPLDFEPPAARESVTGGMEVDPEKDLPPLSWKLVGWILAALAGLAALVFGVWQGLRLLVRRVKEHRMSPIERAWVELDRLLRKGLPGRGRYKDFYVELTMVVRRYVQRKYGIKAPHLTTEEFLREVSSGSSQVSGLMSNTDSLRKFLESADMVKFAGVEATPEMADEATDSAKGYLKSDDSVKEGAK